MSIKQTGSNNQTIIPPPLASQLTIKPKSSSRPKHQQGQHLRHTSINFKTNSLLNSDLIKEVKGLNTSQHHNSKHEINAHSDLQAREVQSFKISQDLAGARKNETGIVLQKGEVNSNKIKESRGDNKFVRNSMTQGQTRNKRSQSTGNLKGEIAGIKFGVEQKIRPEKRDERSWNQKQIKQKKSSGHRSRSSVPSIRSQKTNLKPQPLQLNPHKSIPQQIIEYIKKRSDVEIVQHFQEYKNQFTIKSKTLNNYLYSLNQPEADKIKNTYLNQNDSHYKNGLEAIMLKLYRNGTIVPQSYTNLRQEAVEEIQKWVLGWIHRKISYGKLVEDEDNQIVMVEDALKHLDQYRKIINSQDTSF